MITLHLSSSTSSMAIRQVNSSSYQVHTQRKVKEKAIRRLKGKESIRFLSEEKVKSVFGCEQKRSRIEKGGSESGESGESRCFLL